MIKIKKQRISAVIVTVFMCLPGAIWASNNPFDKGVDINIGSDREWVIKDKAMTRSGSEAGDFYHFSYDRKQIRLRITDSVNDDETSARQYQQFTVEDIQVDGQRLPLFQWCLVNQEGHSRSLQQGMKVKQDVCVNQGEQGTFTMRLNAATLEALNDGKTLSFMLKPFRLPVNVNIDISDFSTASARLAAELRPVQKPKAIAPEKKVAPVMEKVAVAKKCSARAPKGFNKIKSVEYVCADGAAKTKAEADINAQVEKVRAIEAKQTAEKELKRKQAEAEQAEKQKAEQARLAAEQAALAEIEASKLQVSAEITDKMLAVCMKQWQKGQHRCYCEKFLEHAPEGIESDASCGAE